MSQKPSIIIIGAGGFIGSSMSLYLRQKGFEISEILRGQISGVDPDFKFLSRLLTAEGEQIVIDFSYTSVPNTSFKDPVKDYSENLYNVIRHLEFAKQLPNATYIYVSSGGTVYGNPGICKPLSEKEQNNPLSPYGITKLCCEKYVMMYKQVHGLKTQIIRPSNIYGPGQKPFRGQGIVTNAIAKMIRKEPLQVFGDGDQVRDYLFIDDFCDAVLDVITFGKEEIFNIGFDKGYSINDLLAILEEKLNIPAIIEHLPYRPFDVVYNVLESSKLKALNNWEPKTNIDQGLDKTIQWQRYQYSV